MLKTRVVLDTNVIVSFLLTRGERISSIFDSWDKEEFDFLISEEIFKEIETVLEYEKIQKLVNPWEKAALLEKLKLQAEFIKVKTKLDILPDQKDNKYLECAVDGWADFIISGDKHLLELKEYRWIKIMTPREFLTHDRGN
jgi:putative PIN family toxin of toxin-antitoxin system